MYPIYFSHTVIIILKHYDGKQMYKADQMNLIPPM